MEIEKSNVANLPSRFGQFKIKSYKQGHKEHLIIYTEKMPDIPTVRIHSECLTGDALGSLKCDCRDQLEYALEHIHQNGGMVIYLRQEGRDIGLLNKVNAYALQDTGLDTVEANHQLGFEADLRRYEIVEEILKDNNISKINLLTNNPKKLSSLNEIEIVKRVPIILTPNEHNENYLKTKKSKLGHMFE
jgi:GTP cyclohydrolase II